jgi:TRAP-type C4-dicarboxylate transport system permease large subunit
MVRGSATRPTSAIGEVMTAAPGTTAAALRPQMDDEPRSSMPSAPARLSRALGSRIQVGLSPHQLVLVVLLVVFVAGFFLDWFEIVLIMLPLLAPVIKLAGLDMTWFLILVALMLQTSFLTPPVGFSLFYLKGVVPPGVTIGDIYRGIIPFVILQLLMVGLCFVFPQVVLWLPEQMYGTP